ncbi:hypothetical protein TCAL_10416 [Tigriopus californicus]|uniref:Uncharacterized protein n=1 Tax=Tigriopus californicus TaxID=6832 RepID=A0A553PL36_TIGCA|nr:uncharacterized protein LOC131890909 [Tigriopus californicus]TRY78400.1 hypothetical protein TCAL_10416 [Tigriopus californicus]|eukprot:TCALIF_10416-PA protein Name:"Protein of unknown function" AED:0.31 eAED:0.31 QI:0/1/0/1/1/1/2/0/420
MIAIAIENIMKPDKKRTKVQNFMGTDAKKDPTKPDPPTSLFNANSLVLFINVFVVLACTGGLIFQGSQCLKRFWDSETKAILSVKPSGEATFLAFTFCPSFKDAYSQDGLAKYGLTVNSYKSGDYFGNQSTMDTSKIDGYDVFADVTYELSELLKVIEISLSDPSLPSVVIDLSKPLNSSQAEWTTIYDDTFGRCYHMYLNPAVTRKEIVNMEIEAKAGIYIYLHHPGQRLDVDSKTKVFAELGNKLFIDLAHELSTNTLGQDGEMPCDASMDWDYDGCIYEKLGNELWNSFGCVLPFMPSVSGRSICRFDTSTQEGLEWKHQVIERYNYLSSTGQRGLCAMPCSTMEVFLGLPFDGVEDPDIAYIKMYIKSTVKVKKTVLDYTWLSMLAEIGGYTGLLLGISVVNITNVVDKVVTKCFG